MDIFSRLRLWAAVAFCIEKVYDGKDGIRQPDIR